jgi:hypothetical protein
MPKWTNYIWPRHDHSACPVPKVNPKVYDETKRRYGIYEFEHARFIEAFEGTEKGAEARCIELHRLQGKRKTFFYKAPQAA